MKGNRFFLLLAAACLWLSCSCLQGCVTTAEVGKTKLGELNSGMSGPGMKYVFVKGAMGDVLTANWKNYYTLDGEFLHLALTEFYIKYHKRGHIRRQAVDVLLFDKSSDHLLAKKEMKMKRITGQPLLENLLTRDEIIRKLGEPHKIFFGELEDLKEIRTDWWSGMKEIGGKAVGDELLYYERENGKEVLLVLIDDKTRLLKGVMRLTNEQLTKDPEGDEISTSGGLIGFWESPVSHGGDWLRRQVRGDSRYFESLVRWSKEESVLHQRYAIELIGELNDQASFDYLIASLANKDGKHLDAGTAAASALGKTKNPKAVGPLLETLKNCRNLTLCRNAVWSLKLIDDPGSIEPLKMVFKERKRWPKLDEEIALVLNLLTRQEPGRNYREWLEVLGNK